MKLTQPASHRDRRVWLIRQPITREMRRAERDRLLKRLFPRRQRLPRDRIDQIHIQPAEASRPRKLQTPRHILRIVMSLELLQLRSVETLRSEADPTDPAVAQH